MLYFDFISNDLIYEIIRELDQMRILSNKTYKYIDYMKEISALSNSFLKMSQVYLYNIIEGKINIFKFQQFNQIILYTDNIDKDYYEYLNYRFDDSTNHQRLKNYHIVASDSHDEIDLIKKVLSDTYYKFEENINYDVLYLHVFRGLSNINIEIIYKYKYQYHYIKVYLDFTWGIENGDIRSNIVNREWNIFFNTIPKNISHNISSIYGYN